MCCDSENDFRLAAAFGISQRQHQMYSNIERTVNTNDNVAKELRRRYAWTYAKAPISHETNWVLTGSRVFII